MRINNLYLIGLLCGVMCLLSFQQINPNKNKSSYCALENKSFSAGEKLTYKVYYNWKFIWLPAGEVVFEIKEDEDYYYLEVEGKTYPSYDGFFKVRDYFYSKVDKQTLLPHTFRRDVLEGKYVRFDSIIFNQEEYTLKEYFGKSRIDNSYSEFKTKACVHDVVSVLYHLRNIPIGELAEKKNIEFSVFLDMELYQPTLSYIGNSSKKVKNWGEMDLIHIRPELIAGEVFNENSYMDIWVSDDKNLIPVMLESPVSIGSVKVILKDYTGLRFPFNIRNR